MVFEDTEQEQLYVDFITQYPLVHRHYMNLAVQYDQI